jgi:hypothetical protein
VGVTHRRRWNRRVLGVFKEGELMTDEIWDELFDEIYPTTYAVALRRFDASSHMTA